MKILTIEPSKEILDLLEKAKVIGESALPNTANVISNFPNYAQNVLSEYVAGTRDLDNIGFIQNPFSPSEIKFNKTKIKDFDYKISVESKKLSELQEGKPLIPEYDMKKTYPYGNKSRRFKNGTPYLIIPFRWGTPNDKNKKRAHFNNYIPQADYITNVKPMEKTFVSMFTRKEANAKGQMIDRAIYEDKNGKRGFASRIKNGQVDSPVSQFTGLNYSAGMVRMRATDKSTYWSFRIITPFQNRKMWIRKEKPAIPAIDVESAWTKTMEKTVYSTIEKALMSDFGL